MKRNAAFGVIVIWCGIMAGCFGNAPQPSPPATVVAPVANPANDADRLKPGQVVRNSIGMELVVVTSGDFVMGAAAEPGSEQTDYSPSHPVTVRKPFLMGVYEVTQEEYAKVMEQHPSFFAATGGGDFKIPSQDTRRFPVDSVSWQDAAEFCKRLSSLPDEVRRGMTYRLPTEAEWEYACRAGSTSSFPGGETLTASQANVRFSSKPEEFLDRTAEVGSYPANAWGLHDMVGNVYEWCSDPYDSDWYQKKSADSSESPPSGNFRVLRGGCWFVAPEYSRSFSRDNRSPLARDKYNGFRVVASSPKL